MDIFTYLWHVRDIGPIFHLTTRHRQRARTQGMLSSSGRWRTYYFFVELEAGEWGVPCQLGPPPNGAFRACEITPSSISMMLSWLVGRRCILKLTTPGRPALLFETVQDIEVEPRRSKALVGKRMCGSIWAGEAGSKKRRVNIEYGLCEVLCMDAMRIIAPPKDGIWFPDVSELEALLPAGTLDHSVDCLKQQLPLWEEPLSAARERYHAVIEALADKFPHENLLLVTHGEAVGVSVSSYLKDAIVYDVDYCAYTHLQRQVCSEPSKPVAAGGFKLVTSSQAGLLLKLPLP